MEMKMTQKVKDQLWRGEKAAYARAFSAIKGSPVKVLDVEPENIDAIAYTRAGNCIYINREHPHIASLNEDQKRAFRCGVAVHELMHQLLTDFVTTTRKINSLSSNVEREVYKMIENYVEDARIENFAPQFIGGRWLKCLGFAIGHTYNSSRKINEAKTGFEQFILAVEQFGDMGFLKGRFTDPAAKEIFVKIVPYYKKAINETVPRRVLAYVDKIYEASKPLWKDQKEMEELMKKLMQEAEANGKGMRSEGGKAATEADGEGDTSSTNKNREITTREVSRKEFEEARAKSSKGGKGGSGASEILKCKDATTAEEAQEAADEAKESAQDAQDAANDAKAAANEAKGTPDESKAQSAAERAQRAANRASEAAKRAQQEADLSKEAKAKGDEAGEKQHAKQAGREALNADAAARSAQRADDEANGKGETGSSSANPDNFRTAQDAQEAANEAQEAADDAKASAAQAKAKAEKAEQDAKNAESSKPGSGEAKEARAKAEMAKRNAERAEKAAQDAQEAANSANHFAENAKKSQEASNDATESANASAAAKAMNRAKKAAEMAKRAAESSNNPGEKANDAVDMDYSQVSGDDDQSASSTERAINGARPDYRNCTDEIDDDFENIPTEFTMEDYELSEDDFASIETEIKSCLERLEKQDADLEKEERKALPDFDIRSAKIATAKRCLNKRVKIDDQMRAENLYSQLVSQLRPGINSMTGKLKNIFQNDIEVTEYRRTGKINFDRVNSGRMTSRVFDRHRAPAEKANTAIMILVDESGSMSGRNSETAKQTAISLAETFKKVGVPTYVIGFTADAEGYDAIHHHYVTWTNSKTERLRLLDITARCNNFDGYSIRYAGKILEKHNAEHKLLIVVSDGSPACRAYHGVSGIADTKDAIKDVRRFADVLGVLVGPYDVEDLQSMYKNDFINIREVRNLFEMLSNRIIKIVQRWD